MRLTSLNGQTEFLLVSVCPVSAKVRRYIRRRRRLSRTAVLYPTPANLTKGRSLREMTTKKTSRRALLTSVMALVMCLVMLVGTTFAWFTDSVTSGVNTIKSGNLDVELTYKTVIKTGTETVTQFVPVTETTKLFDESALWEPGHVEYTVLKVANVGSLVLKYQLGINVANEVAGKTAGGADIKLSQHLKYAVIEGDATEIANFNRDTLVATAEPIGAMLGNYTSSEKTLYPAAVAADEQKSEETVTLVVWMPTTVGNEANHNGTDIPAIDLGVSLVATQKDSESDSFGPDYDAMAEYPEMIRDNTKADGSEKNPFEEAVTKDDKNITVNLATDVTYDAAAWAEKSMGGASTETITINGNGHKITFNNTNSDWNSITTSNGATLIIKNAVIDNSGYFENSGAWNSHDIYFNGNVELYNVVFTNAVAISGKAVMRDVKISDSTMTQDTYMLWICAGSTVDIDGLTIDGVSTVGNYNRAIAIKDQYITDPTMTTLTLKNATISSDKKAAVLVTSKGGANITLVDVDITGVKADTTNVVWVDNGAGYGNMDDVTVDGGTAILKS